MHFIDDVDNKTTNQRKTEPKMNDQRRMKNENKNENENENRNFEYSSRRYMVDYKHDSRNNRKRHFMSLPFAESAECTSGNWISNYTLLTDSKKTECWILNVYMHFEFYSQLHSLVVWLHFQFFCFFFPFPSVYCNGFHLLSWFQVSNAIKLENLKILHLMYVC